MSLQRQNIQIPMGVGVNQKADDKQLDIGKLLVLENCVFQKTNKAQKRYGFLSKSQYDTNNNIITSGLALINFKDELNLITNDTIYSYLNSNKWLSKGAIAGASIASKQIIKNNYNQYAPTSAYTQNITVFTWVDSSGGVRYSVVDQQNNEAVLNNGIVSSTGIKPLVIAGASYIYIYYIETTTLKVRRIDPLNPTVLTSAVTVANALHATCNYDITHFGQDSFVLVYRNSTPKMAVAYLKTTGEVAGVLDGFPAAITFNKDPNKSISVITQNIGDITNDGLYIVYCNSTDGVYAVRFPTDLVGTPTPVAIETSIKTARNITQGFLTTTSIQVWYEVYNATPSLRYIQSNTYTTAMAAGTPALFLKSVGLNSKAFKYNNYFYFIISYDSTLQATYFTIKSLSTSTSFIINKILPAQGGGGTYYDSLLPEIYSISQTDFISSTNIKGRLDTSTGTLNGVLGVQSVRISFDVAELYINERLGDTVLIAGGKLLHYDGVNITEQGFNLYPEGATGAATNGGNYLEAGTRSAIFIYEWTDSQGLICRSATSIPLQYTTSGGASKVVFTIPTLRLTSKTGVMGEVNVVTYSTIASGTTYYRMTPLGTPTINDVTVDTVTFTYGDVAGQTDINLQKNEILYTTGGILDNMSVPSAKVVKSYNNRMFLLGLEDQNAFLYSKEYIVGEDLGFNDLLTGRIDKGNGGIITGAVLDDKFIFFKKDSLYALAGQGPTDNGQNNDYQIPQQITVDVGCEDIKSIVETPLGIMYKSSKGIYLLDRSLNNKYIGADVEDFNQYTVYSATLLSDINQVRFVLSNDVILFYDYYFNQWGVFTGFVNTLSALVWQNQYVAVDNTGLVRVENKNTYRDDNSFVQMKLTTSWIKLNGVQGFQRVYQGLLIGNFKSGHSLRLQVAYDYNDYFTDSLTLDANQILGIQPYGSNIYGAPYYGGSSNDMVYEFQFKQSQQKCESIKFEVTDLDTYGTDGASFEIAMISLDVGLKTGLHRVSVDKTFS